MASQVSPVIKEMLAERSRWSEQLSRSIGVGHAAQAAMAAQHNPALESAMASYRVLAQQAAAASGTSDVLAAAAKAVFSTGAFRLLDAGLNSRSVGSVAASQVAALQLYDRSQLFRGQDLSRFVASSALAESLRSFSDFNAQLIAIHDLAGHTRPLLAASVLRVYGGYVGALPDRPTAGQESIVVTAGRGLTGLVATDVLAPSGRVFPDVELVRDTDDLGRQVEDDVVCPWLSGPGAVRIDLLDRLSALDKGLPELLYGAWHHVVHPSPAHLVSIATLAVEVMDRALRIAAPESIVVSWVATSGASQPYLDDKGRPTHAARIRYLLRDREGDRNLVEAQVKAIVATHSEVTSRLQAAKHASTGDISAVRTYLLTVEVVLAQLFLVQ
jgi:hypothetical protein